MCIICQGEDISNTTILDCSNCQNITKLPVLPEGLLKLDCSNCKKLTKLPVLPNSLLELICEGLNLTTLPEVPKGLEFLNCSYCVNLTELPYIHDNGKMEGLECVGCRSLITLQEDIDELIEHIDCNDCPWLIHESNEQFEDNNAKAKKIQAFLRKRSFARRLVKSQLLKNCGICPDVTGMICGY